MSKTLQELYVEVIKDASLVSEFAKAEKDGKTAEFAAAHGCSVSEEEIKAFIDEKKNSDVELSLDELETVAGGKPDKVIIITDHR